MDLAPELDSQKELAMTDVELFQTLRQTLPHKAAEIALAERNLRNGDVRSAKIRLSDVLASEIKRIKRYEDSGRVAASVEMLHAARIKVLKGNFGASWGRLRPQLKEYWVQAGKDLKWIDRGLSVVRFMLIELGRGDSAADEARVALGFLKMFMKPYTVAIDVLMHGGARKNLIHTLGDLVSIGKAKAAQLMDRAHLLVRRGVKAGRQVVRSVVSGLRSAGKAIENGIMMMGRKLIGILGV